jgi:hypothetical protein
MNLKLFFLRLLAARLATNRPGPARPELDRARLARQRIALVKLDGIGDFVMATHLDRFLSARILFSRRWGCRHFGFRYQKNWLARGAGWQAHGTSTAA